uniref:Uncharacterized protein n=1 Tax=Glossina austeni TaxID=7395 RepID=A0A1A9UMC8_GLOAU
MFYVLRLISALKDITLKLLLTLDEHTDDFHADNKCNAIRKKYAIKATYCEHALYLLARRFMAAQASLPPFHKDDDCIILALRRFGKPAPNLVCSLTFAMCVPAKDFLISFIYAVHQPKKVEKDLCTDHGIAFPLFVRRLKTENKRISICYANMNTFNSDKEEISNVFADYFEISYSALFMLTEDSPYKIWSVNIFPPLILSKEKVYRALSTLKVHHVEAAPYTTSKRDANFRCILALNRERPELVGDKYY